LQKDADGTSGNTSTTAIQSDEEVRSIDMFYKKSLCSWYERGRCRKGEQCRFAHGADELRKYAEGQSKVSTEKVDDLHKSQRRREDHDSHKIQRGNRHTAGGVTAEGQHVTAAAGGDNLLSQRTRMAPGLTPNDLVKGPVRSSNRYEPMFVQPLSSSVAPALSAPPPPGFAQLPPGLTPHSLVFQPAPCFEPADDEAKKQAFYNMTYSGEAAGPQPISLVEGLQGLAEAPVEELRREWEIMEQHRKGLDAAALAVNEVYCGVEGSPQYLSGLTLQPLQPHSGELQPGYAEKAARYMFEMSSPLIGA
jgi:hypothetical protein